MIARQSQIVVDCASPMRLAVFWSRLLGGTPVHRDPGWSHVDPPGGLRLAFQRVPEPKAGKNRLHLDLAVDDVSAAAEGASALGGERAGDLVRDAVGAFQVMRDPEGNEFCFVSP
ncbi:VOC family protein [Streptosporangium carneum]|uniref:Glyoxalase n=1 Tax=Streptosporangium carneum TaxID=47481 RepID=A0A9W6I9X0_9ACTN|nr:VOC family protein [Streptosporangium carneum]GLK13853.1 glyoxalase [Streptosporangium carneum]